MTDIYGQGSWKMTEDPVKNLDELQSVVESTIKELGTKSGKAKPKPLESYELTGGWDTVFQTDLCAALKKNLPAQVDKNCR